MKEIDIRTLASMPIASPSYPKGPYRFSDREFMIITYQSEPDAIRGALPNRWSRMAPTLCSMNSSKCPTVPVLATTRKAAS